MKMIKKMMKEQSPSLDMSEGADFAANRRAMDEVNRKMPLEPGVSCTPDVIDGIPVELLCPENPSDDAIILDIHGGGFVYGSLDSCRSYAGMLAKESSMRVYTVDYRLAPEHPFPAGLKDCMKVYVKLCEQYPDKPVAVIGESAGATLALAVGLVAKDKGLRLPCCVVAFSPCATMAESFPSRENNTETELVIPSDTLEKMVRLYIIDANDLKNPYVSPLYGDFAGYPPIKLVADSGELLADDTRELEIKAREAGVEVDCRIYDDTFHTFANLGRITEESAKELVDTVKFVREHC